ncbi:hypothetical protein [Actinomadura sediminis]|uniref:Lipoprotein n=1 Tax=Actinomadura sediminis TaxID=1038904 RepID=A0ABW3EHB8_9ACTN
MVFPPLRRLGVLVLLPLWATAACGSGHVNATVDCERRFGLSPTHPCTVTFERGHGPASASVVGAEIELLDVAGDHVVIRVDGRERRVLVEQGEPQEFGLHYSVEALTDDAVVLKVRDLPVL